MLSRMRERQSAAVDDHRRGLWFTSGELVRQRSQVFHHHLETSGANPALRLLIHIRPRRQIVPHKAPLVACANDVTQSVEHTRKLCSRCLESSRHNTRYPTPLQTPTPFAFTTCWVCRPSGTAGSIVPNGPPTGKTLSMELRIFATKRNAACANPMGLREPISCSF
jgi:hypothetical protein